jgi:hypothetical protein
MDPARPTSDLIRDVVRRMGGDAAAAAPITLKPLRGGLEGQAIDLVTARHQDTAGRPRMIRFVVKRLGGWAAREACVYERLVAAHAGRVSPRLLAVDRPSEGRAVIYMEAIRPAGAWPWRDLSLAGELLRQLAVFHRAAAGSTALVPIWDYEAEQDGMATATLAALEGLRNHPDLAGLARSLPATRRMVAARSRLRGQLLQERPFQAQPIHGDVHSGNVLVRRREGAYRPIMLDWARARSDRPLHLLGTPSQASPRAEQHGAAQVLLHQGPSTKPSSSGAGSKRSSIMQ